MGFGRKSKQKGRPEKGKKKKKTRPSLPWYLRPGEFILGRLPGDFRGSLYRRTEGYFKYSGKQEGKRASEGCQRFLAEEIAILFWGMLVLLILVAGTVAYNFLADGAIALKRNPFGKGERDQVLLLKDQDGSKRVAVKVEEQELSPMEREAMFRRFFGALRSHMLGKNKSFKSVNSNLVFDDGLKGYPFNVDYQPEDYSLVGLLGELGEEAHKIKKGFTKETRIWVTASYRDWEETEVVTVILTAPGKKARLGIYDQIRKKIQHMEEASRKDDVIMLPARFGDVRVMIPGSGDGLFALIFLALLCPLGLILRRYYRLKEQDEKRKKEEDEDFPLIVHLLSLYMKAGLSFSSAVHRVSSYYQENSGLKDRTAFMDIVIMDNQLSMGVSQKEACLSWGRRCANPMYQKLSAALVQILVKGSKEGDRILSHMEREAFEQRIDRARKEGNTAQTRLLFPMIILLCLVMIIVLFPAVIRFQGF